MLDYQRYFEQFTRLTGRNVAVGRRSTGESLVGQVAYAMFDSFLLAGNDARVVIPFADLSFVDEIEQNDREELKSIRT